MRRIIMLLSAIFFSTASMAGEILVQSTTSTQNSGFYDYILPIFQEETGISVKVVAVGTGQAIRNAENGDADVLLVHAKAAEEAFVAAGFGVERFDLMYNDFVIIGPKSDPAHVSDKDSVPTMLATLSNGLAPFVSRGDDSGTHKKESALWQLAEIEPVPSDWYHEAGAGMGATIRTAIEMQGYTLTDRATWIAYQDKRDAAILFENDPALFNQYGLIAVNPAKQPHVHAADAAIFIEWLLGPRGQGLIANYKVDGQQLFFPNAK